MRYVKRILLTLAVLFCLFYLISRPEDAADAVRGAVDAVAGAIDALFRFFSTLAT